MTSNSVYAIYGASGCGRSLMPVAREYLKTQNIQSEIYFIDDSLNQQTLINQHKAMNYESFKQLAVQNKYVLIAIANSLIREKIAQRLLQDNISLWSIQASNVIIMDQTEIAEGAALSPFVSITSNLYSYVEHDCVIGDYVTFAPGVKCNGNIHIEDHAYIGTGAVIKQGTPDRPLVIGKGAVVGMGAVVTKSVPPGVTVIGNPARILEK